MVINNFKSKKHWDKLSSWKKWIDYVDLDDLTMQKIGYYKVGNSYRDLDLSSNLFKLLIKNNKFLNVLKIN